MKRIGLRTIKTAISVFLCLMVFIIFKLFEFIPGVPQNFAFSWYNPFLQDWLLPTPYMRVRVQA